MKCLVMMVLGLCWCGCALAIDSDLPIPDLLDKYAATEAVVPAEESKEHSVLVPEVSLTLRDPASQTVVGVTPEPLPQSTVSASAGIPEEDQSLPPLPTIGEPLSAEAEKKTAIIIEETRPLIKLPADEKTIANPRITVIDGRYLKAQGTGKDLSVHVDRPQNYTQYYNYSFNFIDKNELMFYNN